MWFGVSDVKSELVSSSSGVRDCVTFDFASEVEVLCSLGGLQKSIMSLIINFDFSNLSRNSEIFFFI